MSSVLYDAVLVAGGEEAVDALIANGEAVHYASEAYKHAKPVGAIGAGVRLLAHAPMNDARLAESPGDGLVDAHGVVTQAGDDLAAGDLSAFAAAFAAAVARHRHFDRDLAGVPA
jgi:catalase